MNWYQRNKYLIWGIFLGIAMVIGFICGMATKANAGTLPWDIKAKLIFGSQLSENTVKPGEEEKKSRGKQIDLQIELWKDIIIDTDVKLSGKIIGNTKTKFKDDSNLEDENIIRGEFILKF
jgi:hypothetical protein